MNSTNVVLTLTENEEVLATLRKNGTLAIPKGGKEEEYVVQFDSMPFRFTKGRKVQVPENVAHGLRRYAPLVGGTPTKAKWAGQEHEFLSALDAQFMAALEVVETAQIGEEMPSVKRAKATTCGVCGNDLGSIAALRVHLADHEEDLAAVKG